MTEPTLSTSHESLASRAPPSCRSSSRARSRNELYASWLADGATARDGVPRDARPVDGARTCAVASTDANRASRRRHSPHREALRVPRAPHRQIATLRPAARNTTSSGDRLVALSQRLAEAIGQPVASRPVWVDTAPIHERE